MVQRHETTFEDLPELTTVTLTDEVLVHDVTDGQEKRARISALPAEAGETGTEIAAKLDVLLGSPDWRSRLSGAVLVAAIDAATGSTDWRTGGGGPGDVTTEQFMAEVMARTQGDDLQSIGIGSASSYQSALNAQLTSDQPLELVMSADISGTRGGSPYSYNNGDVLYFAPRSDAPEFRFNVAPSDTSGLNQGQVDQRVRVHTGQTTPTGKFAVDRIPDIPDPAAGSIALTPSVIPNAAAIQRDFRFAWEDLDVAALNAAGVNQFEVWIKNTSFHAVNPWTPAQDGVIDVNVNATEALAIAIGNSRIVPVRMVFRNSGTFVSLINTWLEIGRGVAANPGGDPANDLTRVTIDGQSYHIRDDRSFEGDHIVREFVNGNAALGLVLARHVTATDHRARLLVMTDDATAVYRGTTYTYKNGDVVYFPPTSIAAEPWFNIRQDLLTNQQKAELIDIRLGVTAINPTAANLQRRVDVFFDPPAILGPTVYAQFRMAGQGPAARQLMAQVGGTVRFTLTQSQAEAIANNVTDDQTTIGVVVSLYDAASAGNLLATVHRDLTILRDPVPEVQTLTSAAAIPWAMGNGLVADLTLAHNATLTPSGGNDGETAILRVAQDATGGRTLTFSGVQTGGRTVGLNAAAGKRTMIAIHRIGSTWHYMGSIQDA